MNLAAKVLQIFGIHKFFSLIYLHMSKKSSNFAAELIFLPVITRARRSRNNGKRLTIKIIIE